MYTYLARTCWGCSTSCFIYGVVIQVISKKKTLFNSNYNSHRFSYKFAFIHFFLKPKIRINFSESWLTMSNSIDLHKGIFLHVIPVCSIVSCLVILHDCLLLSSQVRFRVNLNSLVAWLPRHSNGNSSSNRNRIDNHLICKQTLNYLAKLASLAKWLSVHLRTKWLWDRNSLLSVYTFRKNAISLLSQCYLIPNYQIFVIRILQFD